MLPPYKGQGCQTLPQSSEHPYCVQGTKPDPREVTRATLPLGNHWLFIFFTQTKLMKKGHKPQFPSEETEAQNERPCSKSQNQGPSQVSGLQAQCSFCDTTATFVFSWWMRSCERDEVARMGTRQGETACCVTRNRYFAPSEPQSPYL